jgi:hypothetical protein
MPVISRRWPQLPQKRMLDGLSKPQFLHCTAMLRVGLYLQTKNGGEEVIKRACEFLAVQRLALVPDNIIPIPGRVSRENNIKNRFAELLECWRVDQNC